MLKNEMNDDCPTINDQNASLLVIENSFESMESESKE